MKRLLAALLVLALCMGCASAEESGVEKYDSLPEIFKISVEENERKIEEGKAYVYKEYVTTTNSQVNGELREIVDGYDEEITPTLQMDPRKKGSKGSALNVDTVYYRTGTYYVSTLTIARVSFREKQLSTAFTSRTWNLETGERLKLTDLFPEDSEAWDVLAEGVRTHMNEIFPDEERDSAAIEALCSRESLEEADFTLSGMELTLHYAASAVIPGKVTLTHVRFFYPQFEGMMTETGVAATDNSRWKMVAVTCDDGPKDYASSKALENFRKYGVRVTYFTVGKQLDRYGYVLQKQYDQNQIFATHTFGHVSGYALKKKSSRLKQLDKSAEWTLKLVGEQAKLFRAPGGTYPPWVEAGMPLPIIQWSVDTYDYTGKQPKAIFYSFRDKVKEGDIVLCHDTGKYLHKSIPLWAEYMEEHGFMFVTVDELAAAYGVTLEPSVVYWSVRPGENSVDRSNLGKK